MKQKLKKEKMIKIIGDQGKRKTRYNPDLARKVNEETKREMRKAELKARLKDKKTKKVQKKIPADLFTT